MIDVTEISRDVAFPSLENFLRLKVLWKEPAKGCHYLGLSREHLDRLGKKISCYTIVEPCGVNSREYLIENFLTSMQCGTWKKDVSQRNILYKIN